MTKDEIVWDAVKEFIILFGFLEGYFLYVKINPTGELISAFKSIMDILSSLAPANIFDFSFILFLFNILLLLGTLAQIMATYQWGGFWGLVCLLLAFISGLLFGFVDFAVWLLLISAIGGFISFKMKNVTFTDVYDFFKNLRN